MAKKPRPTNAVMGAAREYARRTLTNAKTQKKIKRNTSELPVLRQLRIDTIQQDTKNAGHAVKSAVQFAKTAGSNNRQIGVAYYKGAIKGVARGIKENFRNK